MFFRRDDLDDSDFNDTRHSKTKTRKKRKEKFSIPTLPLIIIGSLVLVIVTGYFVSKLFKNEPVVFYEKLYYINLLGETNITLYQGDTFVEAGYTGTDDEGNDLTSEVAVVSSVNSDEVGNYKVSYTLGNITKERIVKVIEIPENATQIHLYGDVNVFLYVGEKYEEKRCEVIDAVDGADLNDKVIINSNVDTSKEGIYRVTYSVTNSRGVTTSKERTVIVIDPSLSLIPEPDEPTNGNVTINIYARDELFSYLILPDGTKEDRTISTYPAEDNGTYKFIMYNTKGESKEKDIEITNIDREAPSGSCSGTYGGGVSKVTVKAQDDSGISRYVIDGTSYTTNNIKLNKEFSSVSITIYDKAGNMKDISCKLVDTGVSPSTSSSKKSSSKPSSSKPQPITYKKELTLKKFEDPGFTFQYWLNVPDKATEGMPLLIFLHGGCNVHDPNAVLGYKQVNYAIKEFKGEPFIYLAPVNPTNDWHTDPNVTKALKALLDQTVKDFKIDKKRIYVMGFSMGAIEVWNIVNNYPDYFAAAVPMSCCALPNNKETNFLTTKIRAISGTVDINNEGYYNQCMTSFVNKINKAGGKADKDTYTGQSHSTISAAIKYDELFTWLLKQKKT